MAVAVVWLDLGCYYFRIPHSAGRKRVDKYIKDSKWEPMLEVYERQAIFKLWIRFQLTIGPEMLAVTPLFNMDLQLISYPDNSPTSLPPSTTLVPCKPYPTTSLDNFPDVRTARYNFKLSAHIHCHAGGDQTTQDLPKRDHPGSQGRWESFGLGYCSRGGCVGFIE
jgi:hypothetical protein